MDALDQALRCTPEASDPGLEIEAYAGLLRSGVIVGPERAHMDHWVRRVKALMPNVNVNQAVQAALAALNYLECLGVSAELRDLVERVRPLIDQPVLSPILLCRWLANEAVSEILFLDDEAQGFAQLARSLDIAHKNGLHALMPYLHLTYTLAHLFIGDFAGAQRRIGAFTSTLGCMGGPIDCLRGAIAIQAGRVEEGVDLVRRGHAQMDVSGSWLMRVGASLYLAMAEAIGGNYRAAIAAAAANRALYSALEDGGRLHHAALAEAYAKLELGDHAGAGTLLAEQLAAWRQQRVWTCIFPSPLVLATVFAFALKHGIERDYVEHLIKRHNLAPPSPDVIDWPWPVRIRALGSFEVLVNQRVLPKTRKAPRKLLLVLKAIVALGGEGIRQEELADLLWPDHEGDLSLDLLATALLRLRRLLGCPEAIELREGRVSLGHQTVWTDVRSFERLANEALRAPTGATEASVRALDLYRGGLLVNEPEVTGGHVLRDRLRAKFMRLVSRRARQLEEALDFEAAAALLESALAAEPSIEAFHESLHRIQQAVPAQLKPSCMERGGTGPSPLEGSGGKKRNSSISL